MTSADRARRLLAAPVLGEQGGGIGQVSGLLWDAMRDTWPESSELVTLLRNGHLAPRVTDKVRFGMSVAARRLKGGPSWTLFSHLGLARVDGYLPAGLRTPFAVYLHGIEAWRPLAARDRDLVRGATLRIANSRFTASAVAAANPGVGDIVVCHPSLAKGSVVPEHAAALGAGRPTVLIVGRLAASERYKGHDRLIRAWPGVIARIRDARLVIAGDGDDAVRLQRLAGECGVSASVRFTGFLTRPALDEEYARASLFAMPSGGEGFGLVYLEAMAHGLPCVGSRRDAAGEIIADGTTGVLLDPEDEPALARAIADLLESPERRRAMGEAARARVMAAYRYDRFRREIVGLLQAAFPGERSAG